MRSKLMQSASLLCNSGVGWQCYNGAAVYIVVCTVAIVVACYVRCGTLLLLLLLLLLLPLLTILLLVCVACMRRAAYTARTGI
jgi:hypothetical protein